MLKNMQEVLEYGFEVLNRVYFESALPMPVITIMTSPRTNGHFTINKPWRIEGANLINEINISAEHLDRPIENIMGTLCHEMVHFYCHLNGIKDTSQNYRYHNKHFKEEAEKRGLSISYVKYIGWSRTEPTEDFINILKENEIEKPLDINRDGDMIELLGGLLGIGVNKGTDGKDGKTGIEKPKKKTSTRTYKCPCCGNSFRATKDLRVMCMDCMEEFVKVKPEVG